MPNWCGNTVTIDGPKERLDEVIALLETPYVSPFIPRDPDAEHRIVEGVFLMWNIEAPTDIDAYIQGDTWYQENCRMWGTKWDAADAVRERYSDTSVTYRFDTAWSPAAPAINTLAIQNPDLTIRLTFSEGGMDYEGDYIWKNGEIIQQLDGTCRDRWCELCDAYYRIEWDDKSEQCNLYQSLPKNSFLYRMHRMDDTDATPLDEVIETVYGVSEQVSENGDDEAAILRLALYREDLPLDAIAFIMGFRNGELAEYVVTQKFDESLIRRFQESGSPEFQAIASQALVILATRESQPYYSPF